MNRHRAPVSDQIEFVEPRELAFGESSPAEFSGIDLDDEPDHHDDRRGRSATAVWVTVIVLMVAGGVVAASPWSGDGGHAAPTTTSVSGSVQPPGAGRAATRGERPPGYVLDPVPTDMTLQDAVNTTRGLDTAAAPAGWGEVWATDGATRTSGRWFSAALLHTRLPEVQQGAERVQLLGRTGLLSATPDGVLRLVASVPGTSTRSLAISSFGYASGDLVSLFQFMTIDDDHPQAEDDRFTLRDPFLGSGLRRVAAGTTHDDLLNDDLWGRNHATTWYRTGDGRELVVLAAPAGGDDALRDLIVDPIPLEDGAGLGGDLMFGTMAFVGGEQALVARWTDDDTTVTVYSTLGRAALVEALGHLRRATADEWRTLKTRISQTSAPAAVDGTSAVIDRRIELGSGTLGTGRDWSAALTPPSVLTIGFADGASTSFGVDAATPVDLWSAGTWSVAMCFVDPTSNARTMRVRTHGGTVAEVALVDTAVADPASSFAARAAAYVFDQTGPARVELVDANGDVVDRMSTPGFGP